MFNQNGTYYTEEYSVNFGTIRASSFTRIANTWTDWHLIPSSRPSIALPPVVTKYVELPGADGPIDLSEYLVGRVNYGQRTGTLQFYVDNNHENWDTIRSNILSTLHGKKLCMTMAWDPNSFYRGRFAVEKWDNGSNWSSVDIKYELEPFKYSRPRTESTFNVTYGAQEDQTFYINNVGPYFGDVKISWPSGITADVNLTRDSANNRIKVVVPVQDTGGDVADTTLTILWRGGTI